MISMLGVNAVLRSPSERFNAFILDLPHGITEYIIAAILRHVLEGFVRVCGILPGSLGQQRHVLVRCMRCRGSCPCTTFSRFVFIPSSSLSLFEGILHAAGLFGALQNYGTGKGRLPKATVFRGCMASPLQRTAPTKVALAGVKLAYSWSQKLELKSDGWG